MGVSLLSTGGHSGGWEAAPLLLLPQPSSSVPSACKCQPVPAAVSTPCISAMTAAAGLIQLSLCLLVRASRGSGATSGPQERKENR